MTTTTNSTTKTALRKYLAVELRAAIARSGLTRGEVASHAGMRRLTLGRKMSGKSGLYLHDLLGLADAGIVLDDSVWAAAQKLAEQVIAADYPPACPLCGVPRNDQ